MNLTQAMNHAAEAVHLDRQKYDARFGAGLFDRAVAHHTRRNLRVDLKTGTVRDVDGVRSQYVHLSDFEAQIYEAAPHFVWFDFFLGCIGNSVSRMSRGLQP